MLFVAVSCTLAEHYFWLRILREDSANDGSVSTRTGSSSRPGCAFSVCSEQCAAAVVLGLASAAAPARGVAREQLDEEVHRGAHASHTCEIGVNDEQDVTRTDQLGGQALERGIAVGGETGRRRQAQADRRRAVDGREAVAAQDDARIPGVLAQPDSALDVRQTAVETDHVVPREIVERADRALACEIARGRVER